jgi:hypothetical protein
MVSGSWVAKRDGTKVKERGTIWGLGMEAYFIISTLNILLLVRSSSSLLSVDT